MKREYEPRLESRQSHKPSGLSWDIFPTGTSVSQPQSVFVSLFRQIRELRREGKRPQRKLLEITAQKDLSALDKLIEQPSPFVSLLSQIRDLIGESRHPTRRETTASPVEIKEIWSKPHAGMARVASLSLHLLLIAIAIYPWASPTKKRPQPLETVVTLYTPPPTTLLLHLPQEPVRSGGGGGGGKREPTPASLGRLPRAADRQFVPPDPELPKNPDPKLIVDPTIVAPQLAQLPQISLLNIGDPFGVPGPPSSGPGTGGGIGTGQGRGVGEGRGPGVGPGEGGGVGGGQPGEGFFRIGQSGITPPVIIYRVEPKYSEEARRSRYQGTVVLQAIVRRDGTIDILRVVRSLGFGLDENAIDALKQWRFQPGTKNGQAVDVALNVEVNFNLR